MREYNCINGLIKCLSNAVDEVVSCALDYDGDGPYRVLIDGLNEVHEFGRKNVNLLIAMIKERIPKLEIVDWDDELLLYTNHLPGKNHLPFTPERTSVLLDRALDWIGEMSRGSDLYGTLKDTIGMTDKEITAAGFELSDYFDESDEQSEKIDPYTDAPEFCLRMIRVPGIDNNMLAEWVEHAFSQAVIDEEDGVPREEAREAALNEFAGAFEKIERCYGETAAEIFNYKAGYVAHELYGAAAFIANGGNPGEAYELAHDGAFEGSDAPDEEPEAHNQGFTQTNQ